MKYTTFINTNIDSLQQNYKSRHEFIHETPFFEYCEYVFVGLKNGCYIPSEHKKNIIIGDK
jgi:hypothetical protein